MKKICLFLLFGLLVFSNTVLASNLDAFSLGIHSPQQLAGWLVKEFKYRTEMPDQWQSAEETFKLKQGDCEDFAIISQKILKDLGFKGEILVVKFRSIAQSHALCIFKQGKYFSFISNQKIVSTKATSIKEAISQCYPDWERISYVDAKRMVKKIVTRIKENEDLSELFTTSLKED
ncbi:MAG: transglutaminase domain-containing protein [Candidatus Omnitrophica bacterium]|nr:transglutaminase domain-containing protein [Candidatus Omnitrophota bacterium]